MSLKSGDTITESDSQRPSKVITLDNVYIKGKMAGARSVGPRSKIEHLDKDIFGYPNRPKVYKIK